MNPNGLSISRVLTVAALCALLALIGLRSDTPTPHPLPSASPFNPYAGAGWG